MPKWLNRKELAVHLHVSVRTVDSWRKRRLIPHVKVGRVIRFDTEAVEEALQHFEIKGQWMTKTKK